MSNWALGPYARGYLVDGIFVPSVALFLGHVQGRAAGAGDGVPVHRAEDRDS